MLKKQTHMEQEHSWVMGDACQLSTQRAHLGDASQHTLKDL